MTETTEAGDSTIGALLRSAAQRLRPVSETPDLDAGLLLAFVLDKPRSYLFGHPEDGLPPGERERFETLIERRAHGEPVAYLLGRKGFWSLDLAVSGAVLVPRPETETLVEAALARLPADKPASVADLGTGSGAIALAIAAERPDCRIIGIEADPDALSVARDNVRRLGLVNVECRAGDWFAPLAGESHDLIAANPPYVAEGDPHLADLAFEPRAALVADDNGRGCLRHLIEHAPAHLAAGGWLLLEHGIDQADFVRRLMDGADFLDITTEPDLSGHPRVTMGRLPGPAP